MKKKLLMLTLAMMMTTSFIVAFTACGKPDPEDPPAHECTWETTFTKDATHHWYKCTDDTCTEIKDKEEHDFINGACSKCTYPDPDYVEDVEVIGFNTKESVTVLSNTKIVLEKPEPVDQYGETLTVYTDVTTADGKYVNVYTEGDNKIFYAVDGDYVITYAVYPKDKVVTLKTTTVTTVGEATVSLSLDNVVDTGKEVLIVAESGLNDATFTYTVKKDGEDVSVVDGIFTPDAIGYYDVTVTATSGEFSAQATKRVFAREEGKKGEIETFFKGWEDLRSANDYGTHGWSITDTETSGIKNHMGINDTFATIKVNAEDKNVMVWIDPLYDINTYRALVDEGYSTVTMYVYSDASTSHLTELITDPMVGSFLNEATVPLGANAWTKVTAHLADVVQNERHDGCVARSFLSGYNIYAEERFGYLNVDNSAGEEFNLYISDIYVTKDQEITLVEDATTSYKVGDKVDFSAFVNPIDGVDFAYSVQNTFAKTPVEEVNGEYTFKANGTYSIVITPARKDLLGEVKVELTVTDDVTAENGWKKIEMTGDSLTVNFSDLNASFKNGTEVLASAPFAVYYKGNEIERTETGFTVTESGNYKVYYKANYGDGLTTYAVYDVDVYTKATEYLLTSAKDLIATRYWGYSKMPTNAYGEYTVNGVTANMFYLPPSTGSHAVLFRPMFSKAYYEDIINNNDTCQVLFARHIEASGENFFVKSHIPGKGDTNYATGSYYEYIDLSHFIDNYDKYTNAYERELKVVNAGGNPAYNYVYSAHDCLYAANNSQKDTIGIEDLTIVRSYVDETEYLIDIDTLDGATNYDAKSIITDEAKLIVDAYGSAVTYKLTSKFGTVVEGSILDVTKNENKVLWKLEAIANGQAVYAGYVDLYATSDGFVWNDNPTWLRYSGDPLSTGVEGTADTLTKDDVDVSVTKFTYTAKIVYSHFTVKPQHSKTYYEQYRGKVTLKFDIYVEKLDAEGNADNTNPFAANIRWVNTNGAYMSQYANKASAMNNKWLTVSRSINRYLDKWTFVEFDGADNSFDAMVNYGMVLAYTVNKPTGTSSISFTDITFTVAE